MTYYINYIYKSPAFIATNPCNNLKLQLTSTDVNLLSRIICRFNDSLKYAQTRRHKRELPPLSLEEAETLLTQIALPLL